jgi:GT2 family glycosyltransferase
LGYFGGLNRGLAFSDNSAFDYVLVGNNDLVFREDFIEVLSASHFDDDIMVVSPDIINNSGVHENPKLENRASLALKLGFKAYFSSYFTSILIFNLSKILKKISLRKVFYQPVSSRVIYQGSGAFYILTKTFFKYYNLLDDRIFLWGEECLLANQVVERNCKTYFFRDLVIYHNESSSTSKLHSKKAWQMNRKSYSIYKNYL